MMLQFWMGVNKTQGRQTGNTTPLALPTAVASDNVGGQVVGDVNWHAAQLRRLIEEEEKTREYSRSPRDIKNHKSSSSPCYRSYTG